MKKLTLLAVACLCFVCTFGQTWKSLGPVGNSSGSDYIEYNAGQVHSITFDLANTDVFYASCPFGGLWKTTNAGSTWTLVTKDDQLQTGRVSDAAIDPTNSQKIFIATGHDGNSKWGTSAGVYVTTDGGANWSQTGLAFSLCDKVMINRLIINPNNANILLASTTLGLYRTTNGGTTWSSVLTLFETTNPYNSKVVQCTSVEFKANNPNIVYASFVNTGGFKVQPVATDFDRTAEIFKSTDGGATWSVFTNTGTGGNLDFEIGTFAGTVKNIHLATGGPSSHPNWLYAAIQTTASNNNTYLYQFDPSTWTQRSVTSSEPNLDRLTIAVNPADATEVVMANVGIYKSSDQGVNWTSIKNNIHDDCWVLAYHPSSGALYAGGDGGFWKRLSNSWDDLNTGLVNYLVWEFGNAAYTNGKIMAGNQDLGSNYYVNTNSPVWKHEETGDGMEAFFDYSDPVKTYYSLQGSYFKRCTTTFTGCTTLISNSEFYYDHPQGLQDPINADWFYFGDNELRRYDESAGTISAVSSIGVGTFKVVSTIINPYDNNRIYFCLDNPYGGGGFKLYYTLNGTAGAPTWTNIASVVPVNNGNYTITSMAVKDIKTSDNIDTLWIAVHYNSTLTLDANSKKVYMLIGNSGTYTATEFNSGIDQCDEVNSIVIREGGNDELYIGTEKGVYYRNAPMTQWTVLGTGFPKVRTTEVELLYCGDSLRASTFGRGVWSVALPTLNTPDAKVISIASSTTWNSSRTIPTNVVVQAGATLTISGSTTIINMAKNRYIKVKPGAKLLIDGATVTNSCGYMWSGIQVVGDPTQAQSFGGTYYTYQGWLVMNNGAKIENAYVGAMADEAYYSAPDYAFPNGLGTKGGGVIQIDQSSIVQCRNGVGFTRYPAQTYTFSPNKSYVNRSSLTCTGLLNTTSPNYTNEFISMWDTHGIQVWGNTFNGPTSAVVSLRGIGIHSIDADYRVLPYSTTPNTCNDLYRGVYAIVTNPSEITGPFTVDQNVFNGCSRSVYVSGFNYPSVTRNTGNLTLSSTDTTYFLYSSASNYYAYEENVVDGQSQTLSYGIIINNSGPYDNLVYKNTLTDLKYGCVSMRMNAGSYWNAAPGIGLQFKCNIYTNIYYCEAVYTCPACSLYDATIRRWQGYCDGTSTGPAGNQFISIPSGGFSLWKQNIPNIYYLHHTDVPFPPPPNIQNFAPNGCGIYSDENTCPSNFCEPPCDDRSSSSLMTQVNNGQEKQDSLIQVLNESVSSYDLASEEAGEMDGEGVDSASIDQYTEQEQLLNALSEAEFEKQQAITEVVKYFIDSAHADSALTYLLTIGEQYRALPLALASGDYESAQSIIDALPNDEEYQSNLRDYYQIILNQAQTGLSLRDINDWQLDEIRTWATQETPAGFLALNLLYLVNGEPYNEELPIIESSDSDEKQSLPEPEEILFQLLPNPATSTVTVMLNSSLEERVIEVFDFVGKKFQQFHIAPETTSFIINTELWHEGMYFFKVSSSGGSSESDKLIIMK